MKQRRHWYVFVVVLGVAVAALGWSTVPTVVRAETSGTNAKTGRRRSRRSTASAKAASSSSGSPPSLVPPAPYAVGVTHATFVDTTRSTEARGDTPASPDRVIAVTIRYPARGLASDPETSEAPAEFGTFPLVVFAHGFDVSADTYATLESQLASAGFVVVAPDFPLTSAALPGPADEDDVSNQAADVSFVISSMLDPTLTPAVLAGVVASTQVGVIGHSDGGVTAAAVAYNSTVADPRIGAAVVLSGAEARYGGSWFTTASPPLLAIHGTADEVNPFDSSTTLFDGATGPKMLVEVDGGSHLGPFTTDADEPAIGVLVGDFFRAHLDSDAVAAGRLDADASVPGELGLVAQG